MSEKELIFIALFSVALLVVLSLIFLFMTFNNRKNKLIQPGGAGECDGFIETKFKSHEPVRRYAVEPEKTHG